MTKGRYNEFIIGTHVVAACSSASYAGCPSYFIPSNWSGELTHYQGHVMAVVGEKEVGFFLLWAKMEERRERKQNRPFRLVPWPRNIVWLDPDRGHILHYLREVNEEPLEVESLEATLNSVTYP